MQHPLGCVVGKSWLYSGLAYSGCGWNASVPLTAGKISGISKNYHKVAHLVISLYWINNYMVIFAYSAYFTRGQIRMHRHILLIPAYSGLLPWASAPIFPSLIFEDVYISHSSCVCVAIVSIGYCGPSWWPVTIFHQWLLLTLHFTVTPHGPFHLLQCQYYWLNKLFSEILLRLGGKGKVHLCMCLCIWPPIMCIQ